MTGSSVLSVGVLWEYSEIINVSVTGNVYDGNVPYLLSLLCYYYEYYYDDIQQFVW